MVPYGLLIFNNALPDNRVVVRIFVNDVKIYRPVAGPVSEFSALPFAMVKRMATRSL